MMNEPPSRSDHLEKDDERWAAAHRRGNFLTGICLVLAGVIAVLVWYAYPMLKAHDASLHNLPSVTQRLTQTVDSMGDRLKEAEAKAAGSSSEQQSLRRELADLGRNLRARIETLSKQASQSAEEAYRKVEAETKTQADGLATVTSRVSRLESSQESDQVQIAQLKQELNRVRDQAERQSGQQSDDLAQIRLQMEENRAGESEQLAALRRDQDRDQRNIDSVSNQIAVRKIPFEATKDHNRNLADGITLHIESTNAAYRRVSGWIWFAGDHRNIWLQNRSAQEPLIFYGDQDGQKRELVITNVTKNSVTGYLLLPKQAQTAALGGATSVIPEASAQ